MRTYKVQGHCDTESFRRALRDHFGAEVAVEAKPDEQVLRVDRSADAQVVVFLLDGLGVAVTEVEE